MLDLRGFKKVIVSYGMDVTFCETDVKFVDNLQYNYPERLGRLY